MYSDLPFETLIDLALALSTDPRDFGELVALSSVDRRTRAAAFPLLFRSQSLYGSLLQAVKEQPEIAAHVREITDTRRRDPSVLPSAYFDLLSSLPNITSLRLTTDRFRPKLLEHFFALFAPQLTTLHFTRSAPQSIIWRISKRSLPALRSLLWSSPPGSAEDLHKLLRDAPGLRYLETVDVGVRAAEALTLPGPPNALPHLRTLVVTGAEVGFTAVLGAFVRTHCPGLRTLSYQQPYPVAEEDEEQQGLLVKSRMIQSLVRDLERLPLTHLGLRLDSGVVSPELFEFLAGAFPKLQELALVSNEIKQPFLGHDGSFDDDFAAAVSIFPTLYRLSLPIDWEARALDAWPTTAATLEPKRAVFEAAFASWVATARERRHALVKMFGEVTPKLLRLNLGPLETEAGEEYEIERDFDTGEVRTELVS